MSTCASCVFFEQLPAQPYDDGCCHRYPPQMKTASDGQLWSHFPYVDEGDWCGEHKAKTVPMLPGPHMPG